MHCLLPEEMTQQQKGRKKKKDEKSENKNHDEKEERKWREDQRESPFLFHSLRQGGSRRAEQTRRWEEKKRRRTKTKRKFVWKSTAKDIAVFAINLCLFLSRRDLSQSQGQTRGLFHSSRQPMMWGWEGHQRVLPIFKCDAAPCDENIMIEFPKSTFIDEFDHNFLQQWNTEEWRMYPASPESGLPSDHFRFPYFCHWGEKEDENFSLNSSWRLN